MTSRAPFYCKRNFKIRGQKRFTKLSSIIKSSRKAELLRKKLSDADSLILALQTKISSNSERSGAQSPISIEEEIKIAKTLKNEISDLVDQMTKI